MRFVIKTANKFAVVFYIYNFLLLENTFLDFYNALQPDLCLTPKLYQVSTLNALLSQLFQSKNPFWIHLKLQSNFNFVRTRIMAFQLNNDSVI